MARPSDFTNADEDYLKSQYAQYRRTPGSEKEAFRVLCAKHIMRSRDLDVEHIYTLDLFNTKVRNWFQNNAPVKKVRLPMHINNAFHPERVWGMMHQDEIWNSLQESPLDDVDEDTPYVVLWNARRKSMWMELSAEEKLVYQRLAEEWSENGPDDDLKPQMAERRAVSWMKAVAQLFWQQCRMPIFIYGCFEDTKAELQGATFDTSLLFEGSDEWKGKPTFRSSKDWATDFRRYFYEFFTAYICPDLASPESMEYLRTTSKRVVEPCEFERTDEGWPLLPEGVGCDTLRRQDILRLFLRELYGFACGREVLSVPWSSLLKSSDKFFEPGMLPPDFSIGDPSKISREPLKRLFDHIRNIQDGGIDGIPRFQFSHYETGPEGNRQYPIAINSTDVTPWQPRRSKKKVKPPTFDAAPGHTDAEEDGDDEGEEEVQPLPKKSGRRGRFNPGKKFYRDVERLRKEKERAKARSKKAEAKAAAKAAKGKAKASAKQSRNSKGKKKATIDSDDEMWDSDAADTPEEEEIDDYDAMDNDVPEEESDETDGDRLLAGTGTMPGVASEESDDEVEEALERYEDVLSSSAVRKSASHSAGTGRVAGSSASGIRPSLQRTLESQRSQALKMAAQGLPDTVVGESPPPDMAGPIERSGVAAAPDQGRAVEEPSEATAAPDATSLLHAGRQDPLGAPRTLNSSAGARTASLTVGDVRPNELSVEPEVTSRSETPLKEPGIAPRPSPQSLASAAPIAVVSPPAGEPQSSPAASIPSAARAAPSAGSGTPSTPPDLPSASSHRTDWSMPAGVDVAPADVPAIGSARLQYLQSLDGEKAYLDMLTRGSHLLSQTSPIRVQPPLFWASWGHKLPYLPKDAHTADKGHKTLQSVMKFLKKGLPPTCGPADAQRYCLVMGITLKTIMVLQTVEPGDDWLTHLPRYMQTSTVTFDMRVPLLIACTDVFRHAESEDVPPPTDDPDVDALEAKADESRRPSSSVAPIAPVADPPEPPMSAQGKPRKARTRATGKGPRTVAAVEPDNASGGNRPDAGPSAGARRSSRLRK